MLRLVVESVLAQTVPPLEIIIINDGSTDDTAEMVQQAIAESAAWRARVKYFFQENRGVAGALNSGIERATGDWIGFTAQDDLWLPWKLEWQSKAIRKYRDCGLCFTDAWFMNNPFMKSTLFQFAHSNLNGTFGKVAEPTRLVVGRHPIWTQTCIARSDLIRAIGGYDETLRYSEDHDFLFRIGLRTDFCFVGMPMVLIDRSPGEIRHIGVGRNWHKEEFCLRMDQSRFEKQLKLATNGDPEILSIIHSNLSSVHSAWANWYLEQEQYNNARGSMLTALKHRARAGLFVKLLSLYAFPRLLRAIVERDRRNAVRQDRISWQAEEEQGDASAAS